MDEEGLLMLVIILAVIIAYGRINNPTGAIPNEQYDQYTKSYASACNDSEYEEQARCIIQELIPIMNYNLSGLRPGKYIKPWNEFISEGGVCKEFAAAYASTFRQSGWNVAFRYPLPNHVSITISKKINDSISLFCDVDKNRLNCLRIGGVDSG
jgi:hypothetical protein